MDVHDWGAFVRGRWDWKKGGYEAGFPRSCGFTDVDAAIEFDGRALKIEAKHWDGLGIIPQVDPGQLRYLRDEARRGVTVLIVHGCGPCNDPWAVKRLQPGTADLEFFDWRSEPSKNERRSRLKHLIDEAMGLDARGAGAA